MKHLALASLLLCFLVIGLGATTRIQDAGLGCPDWPLCYGALLVPDEADLPDTQAVSFDKEKAWLEVIHRLAAGGLGLAVLLMLLIELGLAYRNRKRISRLIVILAVLVVVQALFGMWTVTLKLLPEIVVLHLIGGMAILGLLFLHWLHLARPSSPLSSLVDSSASPSPPPILHQVFPAYLFLALVITQIILGGWVSANYAALACPDFPLCNAQWLPPADFQQGFRLGFELGPNYEGGLLSEKARVAIHWTHRLGALIVFVFWLAYYAFVTKQFRPDLNLIGIVLLLQVALGITNVLARLPLFIAVAHNLGAALLLLTTLSLIHRMHNISRLSHDGIR